MIPPATLAGELRWLVKAPPLLRPPAGVDDAGEVLRQCAAEPGALERAARTLAALPRPRRLGQHFENLVAALVDVSERYQVAARNLPLRHDGVTLGELDLLIRDRADGALMHWELALKFYLGQPGRPPALAWPGPDNPEDQLRRKIDHLYRQQLPRSRERRVEALLADRGWRVDRIALLARGRLFYPPAGEVAVPPEVHPDHETGLWTPDAPPPDAVPVPKALWHAPRHGDGDAGGPARGPIMHLSDRVGFYGPG